MVNCADGTLGAFDSRQRGAGRRAQTAVMESSPAGITLLLVAALAGFAWLAYRKLSILAGLQPEVIPAQSKRVIGPAPEHPARSASRNPS